MGATIKDIAGEVGISQAAVSRVLNKGEISIVSDETRERIFETASRLGYRRNAVARALSTGRTNTIGLVVGDINAFQLAFLRPMQLLLATDGYNILTLNQAHYKFLNEHTRPDLLPVDGVMRIDAPERVEWCSPPASRTAIAPEVSVGTFTDPALDYVGIDISPALSDAVRHLASTGRRRIALLGDTGLTQEDSPIHAYSVAFCSTARGLGVDAQVLTIEVHVGGRKDCGRRDVPGLLREHGMPDGIILVDDELAIGAYKGLRECGVRIPDDIAVIGCDGIPETDFLECSLSTMQTPFQEMCELAWNYLKRRMEDPSIPLQQTLVTPRLVLRRSSEPRRGSTSPVEGRSSADGSGGLAFESLCSSPCTGGE